MTPPSLVLQRARAEGESGLVFDTVGGLTRAVRDGCFLLAVPADLDLTPGVRLCREFYRPVGDGDPATAGYRGFRDRDVYFDREHFQTEHILTDGPARTGRFPAELTGMTDHMHALALLVLRAVLTETGIAPDLWNRVTAGTVDGRGTHWFAASHYRPEREQPGCAPHQDTGFVTVLYIDQEGLEARVGDEWVSVDPVPGHFLVNFGAAFELLTSELPRPVTAVLHQVRRTRPSPGGEDRFSFAAFVNPPSAGELYRIRADGSAVPVQSVEEFLRDFNDRTWKDRHTDFGITAGQR
ncbi:2OG-Fe(II) oxygenase family protein [Streptomyces sp. N50]|uniref:2OG-Fe(II) oxygenase family protein n=1 Tax=Streptomyces sp. N50 TaxID=3081765 RepID=UPI0029623508|nr:2OG-Fe(II) oxygenase family protein [Streptomyces sp. N50]WOX15318.1 2OG-Fe(II) oxygenase family protein [Streptomyces sp. N50]